MAATFEISETQLVGKNSHGYSFWVGLANEGWIGFALGGVADGGRMMFVLPDVSDDGIFLGMANREAAIKLTGAIAQDPENSYGGIEIWEVPPELRGNPDDYRCADCGRIGCRRDCDNLPYDDFEDVL